MKLPAFEYQRVGSVEDAVEILAAHDGDARPLAGGQSLIPMMAMRILRPTVVVDLNEIPGMGEIRLAGGHLRIGAVARYSKVENHPLVQEHVPFLAEAIRHVGDRFVRNRGTVVGSLAQADPSGEAPLATILLGGRVEVVGSKGTRLIDAEELIEGSYQTALGPDEIITAVEVPVGVTRRYFFHEVQHRHGDYAVVSVGVLGDRQSDGTWQNVAIGIGAVGERPLVFPDAARLAEGTDLGEDVCRMTADAVAAATEPIGGTRASAEYRLHLTRIWVERALQALSRGEYKWPNNP